MPSKSVRQLKRTCCDLSMNLDVVKCVKAPKEYFCLLMSTMALVYCCQLIVLAVVAKN